MDTVSITDNDYTRWMSLRPDLTTAYSSITPAVSISELWAEKYVKISDLAKVVEYITEKVRSDTKFDEQEFISMISGE